jgi:hypothetical protein
MGEGFLFEVIHMILIRTWEKPLNCTLEMGELCDMWVISQQRGQKSSVAKAL